MEVPYLSGRGTSVVRVFGLQAELQRLARRSWLDLSEAARFRFEAVSRIEFLMRYGVKSHRACRSVGVSRASFYRWRRRLRLHGAAGLRDGRSGGNRRRYAPVRAAIAEHVQQLRDTHKAGKEKLRMHLAKQGVRVGSSTVHRVLHGLFERGVIERIGYRTRLSGKLRRAAKRAHAMRKASNAKPLQPGELVQIDTLHERSILGRPRYQFTAQDPSSKWLHAELYSRANSHNAASFLTDMVKAMPFEVISVQVDNGSEFMGEFERACQQRGIAEFTIPPATPKANGMIERTQRVSREEHYAYEPPSLSLEEERAALAAFVHYYNHVRPHQALGYLTPAEYLEARNLRNSLN